MLKIFKIDEFYKQIKRELTKDVKVIGSISISPNNHLLAISGDDKKIQIWNIEHLEKTQCMISLET